MYLTVDLIVSPDAFQLLSSKLERQYFGAVDTHLWNLKFVFTNKYLPSVSDYDTITNQAHRIYLNLMLKGNAELTRDKLQITFEKATRFNGLKLRSGRNMILHVRI